MARKRDETFEDLVNAMAAGKHWLAVAGQIGVSQRTLWRLRHGQLPRPTRPTLQGIADGLDAREADVEAAVAVSRRQAVRRARRATVAS